MHVVAKGARPALHRSKEMHAPHRRMRRQPAQAEPQRPRKTPISIKHHRPNDLTPRSAQGVDAKLQMLVGRSTDQPYDVIDGFHDERLLLEPRQTKLTETDAKRLEIQLSLGRVAKIVACPNFDDYPFEQQV